MNSHLQSSKTRLRDLCLQELLDTETNYVNALELLLNGFSKPLESWLKKADLDAIFENIHYFRYIHASFRTELLKATSIGANRDDQVRARKCVSSNQLTPASIATFATDKGRPFDWGSSSSPAIVETSGQHFANENQAPSGRPLSACAQVARCFLNFRERFLRYDKYCANLSKICQLLDNLISENVSLAAEIKRLEKEANDGRFKLRDLLALPLQRILKYHVILSELLRYTIKNNHQDDDNDDDRELDDPDSGQLDNEYQALRCAHQSMLDIGQHINEVKRDTETIQLIENIQESIEGLIMPPNTRLTDYGRLLDEGHLKLCDLGEKASCNEDNLIYKKKYVFLFDKVLLVCKELGPKSYQFRAALVLNNYKLIWGKNNSPESIAKKNRTTFKRQSSLKKISQINKIDARDNGTIDINHNNSRKKLRFYFKLVSAICQGSIQPNCVIFYVKSDELRRKWIDSICKALDNIKPHNDLQLSLHLTSHPTNNHEFIMYTFERASCCDHCAKLLLGLFYQGYRCRKCFASAHKKCISFLKPCGLLMHPENRPHSAIPPKSSNEINHGSRSPFKLEFNNDDHHIKSQSNLSPIICLPADGSQRTIAHSKSSPCFEELATTSITFNRRDHKYITEYAKQRLRKTEPDSNAFNSILCDYPWFKGRMDRGTAEKLLEPARDGTFLVRVSKKHNGAYILSLKNESSAINHMRVYSKENELFLSQKRTFKSIIELVDYYEQNSLIECFHLLDAKLKVPLVQ